MSEHPSPEALLQDAQLRLDTYGSDYGVLFVEGSDDKRLLSPRSVHRQQIVVANGRGKLLVAHALATKQQIEGLVFLVDCDYEVSKGTLAPSANLIITEHVDIESDLFELSGFERLAIELVPRALESDAALAQVTTQLSERAIAFADALGKIRRVAHNLGYKVDTDSIRHIKYRKPNNIDVDVPKLVHTLVRNADCPITVAEFQERVNNLPSSYDNCNGHDLAAAVGHVLRADFGLREPSPTPDAIETLLRMSTPNSDFENLKVTSYLKRWEAATNRRILAL